MNADSNSRSFCELSIRSYLILEHIRHVAMLILLPLLFTVVGSLRYVKIDIPPAVAPGDLVTMVCTYDLEGDDLYSVKWYKGRQEFFRYVPKELPHIKVFPIFGIDVDVSQSGQNKVVLRNVNWDMSGKYRCEVSTDIPYFHTEVVGAHMHIVDPPSGKPKLKLEKAHYGLGETVRGNCSSPISSPASNITWFVNDKKFESSYENVTAVGNADAMQPEKLIKFAALEFQVTSFHMGKLKIICQTNLYGTFVRFADLVLEEERPKIASILGTYETSTGNRIVKNALLLFSWLIFR